MKTYSLWGQLWRRKSPIRALMNIACAESGKWSGSILDVGGITRALSDHPFSVAEGARVTVLNVDPDAKPDLLADAASIPVEDGSFDNVWCLNLLEHVFDPAKVLSEAARVLRPGGRLAAFTPFLYRVHGHPEDYWRFTSSALEKLAQGVGLQNIRVRGVGGGPFLAGAMQFQAALPHLLYLLCVGIARALDRVYLKLRPGMAGNWPLGYFLLAEKKNGV